MRISRRAWIWTVALGRAARGQDFSTDVRLVNVFATVRDRSGRIVAGLSQDDFAIFEDERRQIIRHFSTESNLPLRVGLLADVSGSMRKRLADEQGAARRFFRQVVRPDRDLAFVARFDQWIEVVQRATSGLRELNRAAGELTEHPVWDPGRRLDRPAAAGAPCLRCSSAICDAVFTISRRVLQTEGGRKALILLSDGMDQGSCVLLRDAVEAAQHAETIVYTVLLPERAPRRERLAGFPGVALMRQLAERTGGRMFAPGIDGAAASAFATIEEDLRNQYSIGYSPDAPSPGFHQIRIATKGSHAVQARDGYYGR